MPASRRTEEDDPVSQGELDVIGRRFEAQDPDVRLMLQVRDDAPAAFEALIDRYQDRLVAVLYHLVGNVEEAEDLTQETFLRIYKSRKGYKPRAKFSTWLFTIASHLAFNHLRRRNRGPGAKPSRASGPSSADDPSIVQRLASREATASSQVRKIELSEIVQDALRGLGEDQRMAVLLSKFEGMSYEQIGDVMSRSPTAVKSLLARARNELRERLQPYMTPTEGIPRAKNEGQ